MNTHATYRRHDGPAPAQATITIDNRVATPMELRGSARSPHGVYPETPNAGAYSIMREDIMLAQVDDSDRENRYSQEEMGVFGTFAGQDQPDPRNIDDYCQKFMFVGLAKNTLTNADDANFMASQGTPRPNSLIAASYIDGGWGKQYTNHYGIRFGDILIWEPPSPTVRGMTTGGSSSVISNTKERLVAKLRPLDWTGFSLFYSKIGAYLLDYDSKGELPLSDLLQQGEFGKYKYDGMANKQCALHTKRNIMTNAACSIKVLQERGYLEVITPNETKKRAALQALYHTVNSQFKKTHTANLVGTRDRATAFAASNNLNPSSDQEMVNTAIVVLHDIQKALKSYLAVVDDIDSNISAYDEMDEEDSVAFSPKKFSNYANDYSNEVYSEPLPRNSENFEEYKLASYEDEMSMNLEAITTMKKLKDSSFGWLTTIMGLGSDSMIQEHHHVTHDIIKMVENRNAMPSSTEMYFSTYENLSNGLRSGDVDELSFKEHAKQASVGMWASWEMCKRALECRIVGRATSVASGGGNEGYKSRDERIDLVIGRHYI